MKEGHRKTVSIVGDADIEEEGPRFAHAYGCGRRLIAEGYRLVTGGRGGVMEAACRGAREAEAWCDGDIVGILPGRDPSRANPYVDIPIATGLQMARNLVVANSEAVIAVGGGAGTLSEIAFAWQLNRPIVALEIPGWSGELGGLRLDDRDRSNGLGDEDQVWPASDPEEAVALVGRLIEDHATRPESFHDSPDSG